MTRSTFATSASSAVESVTSSEMGRVFLRPEASFFALSRVRQAEDCQTRGPKGHLRLQTDCDFDACVGENLDGGFGYKASSKKQCFLRIAQLGLKGRDHGRHTCGGFPWKCGARQWTAKNLKV